jgi:hypothetical protein
MQNFDGNVNDIETSHESCLVISRTIHNTGIWNKSKFNYSNSEFKTYTSIYFAAHEESTEGDYILSKR